MVIQRLIKELSFEQALSNFCFLKEQETNNIFYKTKFLQQKIEIRKIVELFFGNFPSKL